MIEINGFKDWVIHHRIEDITEIKKNVDSTTENKISMEDEGLSTKGKYSKQYVISDFSDKRFEQINKEVQNILKIHFKENFKIWQAWTIHGYQYGYHTLHNHKGMKEEEPHADICTVIYLDVPPRDMHFTGEIFLLLRDKNNEIHPLTFEPKIGDIYIFPVHVFHGTYPQDKGLRQTLNLDFEVIPKV